MKTPSGKRPPRGEPWNHSRRADDLDGYTDLAMKRDALDLARRVLRVNRLDAREFCSALRAILVQGGSLKSWRALVERAYSRLSKRCQRVVQSEMLGYYVSIEDWDAAYAYLPVRTKDPLDLLFSMWTLLNLRKEEAAKSMQRRCLRALSQTNDALAQSALLEALACYSAQTGELGLAEEYWKASAVLEPFAHNALRGLVEINTVRAVRCAAAGVMQIERFTKSRDEQAIILPHNREGALEAARRDLERHQRMLERIVPPHELWRFGGSV